MGCATLGTPVRAYGRLGCGIFSYAADVLAHNCYIRRRGNKKRAAAEDPGRTLVWIVISLACFVTLFASIVVLHRAKNLAPKEDLTFILLSFSAVVLAWMLTHTTFTLRYARLYYLDRGQPSGINFPSTTLPTDWDFAYFAFTVGMTYQVADTDITSSIIRRTVLLHALMSFAYNTAIIALALNIFFGLVSDH